MNWTEGNLACHSRVSRAREVLLRQKAHFAKVRAGLLNANVKISPPSISGFAHPAQSSPARHLSTRTDVSAHASSRKRTRDRSPLHSSPYFQVKDSCERSFPAEFHKHQAEEEAFRQKRRKLLLKGDWTGIALQKPLEIEFSKTQASLGGPWSHSKSRHAKSTSRMRHLLGTKYDDGQGRAPKTVVKATRPTSLNRPRVRVGSRVRVFSGSSTDSLRSRTCNAVELSAYVSRMLGSSRDERRLPHANQDTVSTPNTERRSPILPMLHQPLPHRPYLPSLLRSQTSNADDASSTKARVGMLDPDVPSSQVDENEAWWSFVGAADHSSSANGLQPSDSQALVVISPGISQMGLSKTIDLPDREIDLVELPTAVNSEINLDSEPPSPMEKSLPQSYALEVAIGEVLQDNDTVLAADGAADASGIGSSPPRPKNSKAAEDTGPENQPDFFDDSSEVSLRVFSTSCSPTAGENLTQFDDGTNVGDKIDSAILASILPRPRQLENDQDPMKVSLVQHKMVTNPGELIEPRDTKDDESNNWKRLLFGNSDDILQEAFEKARKETSRTLRHSVSHTNIDEDEFCENIHLSSEPLETTAALSRSASLDGAGSVNQHDSSATGFYTMAAVGCLGTVGGSSPDPLSAVVSVHSDTRTTPGYLSPDPLSAPNSDCSGTSIRTDKATIHSLRSFQSAPSGPADDFLSRSDAWSLVTREQDNESTVAQPPSVSEQSEAGGIFRFARPKPFLGRKIQIDERRQIALSAPQIRGKSMTRRRQKRTGDGRASIRNLPNFSSDPIEEFEETVMNKGAQKPSIFGSLDTEEVLFEG